MLIDSIAEAASADNCSKELGELNRITGKLHEAAVFVEYWGWTDLDTLAEKVLITEQLKAGGIINCFNVSSSHNYERNFGKIIFGKN